MSKLTLKDVKILGEGPQIRNAILQRYNSVEEFYKAHSDITNKFSTLLSYLSKEVIISDSFRCRVTFILDVDYPSLLVSKQEQIKSHVQNIFDNISKYDQEENQQIFDYLIEQCKEEDMQTELALMYRAKARNYYNINRIDRCMEYYEYAIETLPKKQINKLVFFQCEYADDLLRENSIVKADKRYKHIRNLVQIHKDRLNDDTLFFYYYRRGSAYMHKRDYSYAREFFIQAKEHSTHNRAKSSAIANIGLTYKKQRKYDEALKYYMDALNYPDLANILTIASIYNNIAVAYKCKKNYSNALEYIEKAIVISEKENNLVKHLTYVATQAEIKAAMGDEKSYKSIFNILLDTKGKIVHKPDVLIGISSIIENINDIPCLNELGDIIIELRKASTNEDYKSGLTECGGLIFFKIKELDKGVYNEKAK